MAKRKTTLTTRTHDDYRIGIVCALDFEQVAVLSMLDETHDDLRRIHGDGNRYRLGSLSGHNVVIACLPAGLIGTTQASHLVSDMGRSFSKLRFVLMVGIGGGVPSQTRDMRLGDIAVSVPSGKHPGLVEWDRGKLESHGFNRTGSLNIPPLELLHSVQALRGTHMTGDNRLDQHIERAAVQHQSLKETLFSFPGYQWDRLYEADYSHGNATTCAQCDVSRTIPRVDRGGRTPQIFYGNIGSGDEVIKEGLQRDAIAKDSDIICFEMEAAGIAGILPYLVIRGICDYADSHKHKLWQPWAAVTAAAFAKELLRFVESDVEGLDSSTTRIRSTSVALPVISVTGPATIGIGGPATGGNHDRKGHAARHEITAVGARSASPKRSRDEAEQEDTDDGDSSSIGHSYDEMSSLSERKKACLDSLSFPGMKLRESDINRKIPRTCNWLLENDTYKTWESEAGCLWLKGKPGAGKSTMMKFIVDTMRRQRRKRTIIISHFFDARRPGLQKTRAGLLRALLYQLLIRAEDLLLDFLDRCLERRIDENCDLEDLVWHENILESELELIIQNASTTYSVIILVDALDECRGDVITTRSISVYLNDLCSITEDSEHPLAVIVACRPWPEVMSGYDHIITVDECNIEDVRTAISHRLKGQELPQREVASIQRRIEERASGVIQWVLLVAARVVESTMNGADEETMIKVIDEAPQELYEIYGQLLATLSDDEAEKTRHIMQWVCHARTPLSLDDLRVALVMDTDHLASTAEGTVLLHEGCRSAEKMGKRVKLLSRGLLETKSKDGRRHVQFMHHSVREYMIAHGLKILDKGATVSTDSLIDWTAAPSAECRLALACIRYLNIDETVGSIQPPEDSRRTLQQRGFLRYAVMHWMTHVNIAAHSEEEMASIIDGLETWTSLTIASWIAYYETVCVDADLPSNFVAGMNLLNIAVEANLSHVARVILSRGRASDLVTSSYKQVCSSISNEPMELTALHQAAYLGRTEILRMILTRTGKADVAQRQSHTPFLLAAHVGHAETLDSLLEHGAAIDQKDINGHEALHIAANKGHTEVIRLLLDRGVDINAVARTGWTALTAAACWSNWGIVDLLLQRGARYTATVARRKQDGAALRQASWEGKASVVKTLLEGGLDPNFPPDSVSPWVPALYAADGGHGSILDLLVKHGANIQVADKMGNTPLMVASRNGHHPCVQFLLNKGAPVDHRDLEDRTALHGAARKGHYKCVKLLLQAKAEVNARDVNYSSPLFLAASNGFAEVTELLVQNGADIEKRDAQDLTPLMAAALRGHLEVVVALLDHGAHYETTGYTPAVTPLMLAVSAGYLDVVEALLDHGADVNVVGGCDNTALRVARNGGRDEIVALLLARGATR